MSPHVLGVDPSLTATGLAAFGPGRCWTATLGSTGKRTDTLASRDARLSRITDAVADHVTDDTALAVIEGPALASTNGSLLDRYGLWWRIVHRILGRDVPVYVCPPTVLKKWATGKGNADKIAVALAVARLWPAVELADDNQADALGLAAMGAQQLGLALPGGVLPAYRRDALARLGWPEPAGLGQP